MLSNDLALQVYLVRAPEGEAPMFSAEYQRVLREFSLTTHPSSQRGFAMDAADALGGGLGEFLFKSGSLLLPVIGTAAAAYLTGRFGRKVKMKVKDVEVEAASVEQLEEILDIVARYRESITDSSDRPN